MKLLTNKLKSLSLNDLVWRIIVTNRVFDMNFYSLCRRQPETRSRIVEGE